MSKLENGISKLETGKAKFETRGPEFEERKPHKNRHSFWISIFDFRKRVSRWSVGLAAAVSALVAARPALAQGCALCYNTAAAANGRGLAALRHGVLILMIPPVMIFGVVCFFTVRGRNRFNDEVESCHEA